MPIRLPDHTPTRRKLVAVTRRAFLRRLLPAATFTALSPDVALWWRCGRSAPVF